MEAPEIENLSDPWEMALIHRLVRRGFEQSRELLGDRVPPGRTAAVAEYVGFHLDGLHAHHSSEDELIWPLLQQRAGLRAGLVDRMEAQHAVLHEALVRSRHDLEAWRSAPDPERARALAADLAAVLECLDEHLREEERDVVPLIAAYVTQAEWDHLGKIAFGKFTPAQRFTALGELLATAAPEEAVRMTAGLPAPVRLVWRLAGKRRYERFMQRVRGG